MVSVSGKWIKDNVSEFDNYLDVDELEQYVNIDEEFETTLTLSGVRQVELCGYNKKFYVTLPGYGPVGARGYTEENEQVKLDKLAPSNTIHFRRWVYGKEVD